LLFCVRDLKSDAEKRLCPDEERRMRSADRQRRIEQRAHQIWEAEGRPHGKHDEHWHRAEQEIAQEEGRGRGGRRAAGSGGKSASAGKSGSSSRAKTDASAKKTGGATTRTAKPAAAARSTAGPASRRRAKPAGTQTST
jgi:hypothetical protein